MKHQLSIAREGIEAAIASDAFLDKPVRRALLDALTALSELEAMVGEQEPVAWMGIPVMPGRYKEAVFCSDKDLASQWDYSGHTGLGRLIVTPLYAAPVAQQPQGEVVVTWNYDRTRILAVTRQDREGRILKVIAEAPAQQPQQCHKRANDYCRCSRKAMLCDGVGPAHQPQARPDFNDEWTGYLKDGETPFERFLRERKDLQSVLKLYQRVLEENERLKGQQPQAEAVPSDVVRDAERYRWLRAANADLNGSGFYVGDETDKLPGDISWVGSDLDAAIDAAMKQGGGV